MTSNLLSDIYFYPCEIDISNVSDAIASHFSQDTSLHFSPISSTTYGVPFLFHSISDFTHKKNLHNKQVFYI